MGLTRIIIIALGLGLLSECDFLLVTAIKKTKKNCLEIISRHLIVLIE